MVTIHGTEGNDDGVAAPALLGGGTPASIFGHGGDDLLVSGSRPFDPTPDLLHGGTGNDTYRLGALGSFPIYSTPIIWVLYSGDVEIREEIRAADDADLLDLTGAGYDVQTSASFDGSDVLIATFGRTVRLVGNYAVDAAGELLAGVDLVRMEIYGPPPPGSALDAVISIETFDLKRQSVEFGFLRDGTAAGDALAGDAAANVMDGRDGADSLAGGGGDDFIAAGRGDDTADGGDGDDRVFGGDGEDLLRGGAGDDALAGMAGADRLEGGAGNDIYLFGRGDGLDSIADGGGTDDVIQFGAGIGSADITLALDGADLVVMLGAEGLRVLGQVGAGGGRIERLVFADGSALDLAAAYNTAPVAAADAFAAIAGRSIAGNLLADNGNGADRDPDGDPFAAVAANFTTAQGGVVRIGADGSLLYTAAAGFAGQDSFAYTLRDSRGATGEGLVTVAVAPNGVPVAADDAFVAIAGRSIAGNLLADNGAGPDSDPDGDALAVLAASFTTAQGGVVRIGADGSLLYTAAAGFAGSDSFAYTLTDGHGASDTAQVTIAVAANRAPVARADRFAGVEDRQLTGNLLADNGAGPDSDPDGDALAAVAGRFATARGGSVTVLSDGRFTYTPRANVNGPDSFAYTISDGHGGTAAATATIDLAAVNDAPLAVADRFSLATTNATVRSLLANDRDVDGDALSVVPASFTTALGGVVRITADGRLSYRNHDGHVGTDSFNYSLRDAQGESATGQVQVTLTAPTGAIRGTAADDVIAGTALADVILAGGGRDELLGGGGNDRLYGGAERDDIEGEAGNDQLYGGGGNDKLAGGAGADTLVGGDGVDEMKGDAGADRFVFHAIGTGVDLLRDYKPGEADKLDLIAITAPFDPLLHAADQFARLVEELGSSHLEVDVDGAAGPAGWVRIATLQGATGLADANALHAGGLLLLG